MDTLPMSGGQGVASSNLASPTETHNLSSGLVRFRFVRLGHRVPCHSSDVPIHGGAQRIDHRHRQPPPTLGLLSDQTTAARVSLAVHVQDAPARSTSDVSRPVDSLIRVAVVASTVTTSRQHW